MSHNQELECPEEIKTKFLRKVFKSGNILMTYRYVKKKKAKKMYIWFDFSFILKLLRRKATRKHVLVCFCIY